MSNDKKLEVIISADLKQFENEMKKIEKQLEGLDNTLSTVFKASGLAFAGLTAGLAFAVAGFSGADKASKALEQSLNQQGIASRELLAAYDEMANAVEKKTGQDADAIKSGMALAQGYLGETKITAELTQAVSDLAAAKDMDLKQAFEAVAKTIGSSTNGLAKYGVEVDKNATKAEKMAAVVEQLGTRYGGQAVAVSNASTIMLQMFSKISDGIGQRLKPAVDAVSLAFGRFFEFVAENKVMMDLVTAFAVAATVVTGVVTVAAGAGLAFLKLKTALEAARIATTAMAIATKGLVAATGLGLLVVLATTIYLNWSTIWPRLVALFNGVATTLAGLAKGLGDAIMGALSLDPKKISEGWQGIKDAFKDGMAEAFKDIPEVEAPGIQNEKLEKEAAERRRVLAEQARWEGELAKAQRDERLLYANMAHQDVIKGKQDEVAVLKAITEAQDSEERAALMGRLEFTRQNQELTAQKRAETDELERQQRLILYQTLLQDNAEFQAMNEAQRAVFVENEAKEIQKDIVTKATAERAAASERLKEQVKENNLRATEEEKYGKRVADAKAFFRSEEIKGVKSNFDSLAEMQYTGSKEAFEVGKAASAAKAGLNVAEGITQSLTLPFPMNWVQVAAVTASGMAQIQRITTASLAMANGGMITGGVKGKDSVPVVGMPGEVVTPVRDYDDLIEGQARQRGFIKGDENAETNTLLAGIKGSLDQLLQGSAQRVPITPDELFNWIAAGLHEAVTVRGAQIGRG